MGSLVHVAQELLLAPSDVLAWRARLSPAARARELEHLARLFARRRVSWGFSVLGIIAGGAR